MKKLLSILLALSLIISVIPAAFATDISEGITIKYDLSSHLAELGFTRKNTKDGPITETKITAINDITSGLYKFCAGMSNTSVWGNALYARGASSIAVAHSLVFRNYVSFEISVPVDGTYYLSVNHGAHTSGTDVSVYVNEDTFDRGKHADNGTLIGTYSAYTDNTKYDNYEVIVTSDVLNTSGEKAKYSFKADKKYILTFAEDTSSTSNYGSVGSFSLIAGNGAVLITDLEAAFIVEEESISEYNEPSVTGLIGGKVTNATYKGNGAYDLEAPAINENGGKFLYWAKGLSAQKRILVGKTNILTDYVPGENGKEYLIAVYDNELSGNAEYYNANGQLLPDATNTSTVSMAGYGSTNVWEQYGDTNIWVAQYEKEALIDVTVTAIDGTVNGDASATVPFGTEVTCTADETKANFKCWVKNDEIVSVDESYTFHAWEDCTVKAVYKEHTPLSTARKIIIDNFEVSETVTGVMAEFIGFDDEDVVEKGIKFTATGETEAIKIPMTTTDNQLTVVADAGKYVGYAILRNGSSYNLITDGLYEHN